MSWLAAIGPTMVSTMLTWTFRCIWWKVHEMYKKRRLLSTNKGNRRTRHWSVDLGASPSQEGRIPHALFDGGQGSVADKRPRPQQHVVIVARPEIPAEVRHLGSFWKKRRIRPSGSSSIILERTYRGRGQPPRRKVRGSSLLRRAADGPVPISFAE